jgi:hypothetical protein
LSFRDHLAQAVKPVVGQFRDHLPDQAAHLVAPPDPGVEPSARHALDAEAPEDHAHPIAVRQPVRTARVLNGLRSHPQREQLVGLGLGD